MSDYIKDNFLPEDHEQATEELDCFNKSQFKAIEYVATNQFEKAAIRHENASRSLSVLAELRDKHDKAWFIIKQNEADMKMAEMLVKAYD